MELKVVCGCGQKYKFDVEPANGQMPFTVNCPVCGTDGTPVANQLLAEHFITNPAPPPPPPAPGGLKINRPIHVTVPSASHAGDATPPPVAPLPISAPSPGGLRINRPAPATVPASTGSETIPPPIAPLPSSVPAPVGSPLRGTQMRAAALDPNAPAKKPNFWMGMVGAAVGAALGAAVCFLMCFLIVKYAGIGFRFIGVWAGALLTGYLAGAGAQYLGKGEGSKELGGITAIFAIAGIIGAQYFVAMSWWHDTVIATIDSAYGQAVQDARDAMATMPTGSDSEIRNYLVKQGTDEGDDVTANSFTDAQVQDFRKNQLPELKELAAGSISKDEWDAKHGIDAAQEKKDLEAEGETFKGIFLLLLIRKSTIMSLIAAAGLAYRITANA